MDAPLTGPACPPARVDAHPVHFAPSVRLSRAEVFLACQALADADRILLRAGGVHEATALGDLFELLEDRLARPRVSGQPPSGAGQSACGSYSMESELTQ